MKYILLLLAAITIPSLTFAQKIELINSGELIKRATMVHDSGQYKKALSIYDKISRSDTNYVWSLYERAMTCEADSQFNRAIKYCEEALSLPEQRDYEPDIYNIYGNTLHDSGQAEKALTVFDAAIAKYPSYALLYFNKGVVQLALKRYPEAEALFQKALMVNPYMYSAHYQLGLTALQQGKIIPAYLCFTGYLLMTPSGKYWSKSINLLNQISKGTDEILEYKNKRTITPDENYQAMEDIVISKIALDKGYKPIIALDDAISRQIQAVFEKLEYSDSNNDFYIQYYLPYYKKLFNEGKFEPFINHIFSSATVPMIQEYNKKNKKTIDAFVDEAAAYFDGIRATRELSFKKRDQVTDKYYFENGKLVGKGVLTNNGKTLTGHWEFYYPAGNIKGLGEYNAQGGREGTWMFYRMSGRLKGKEQYRNGKLEGEADNYFENGNPSSHEPYVNDQLDGVATTYYYAGNIKSKSNYKQGKKNGEAREYYSNGNLYSINNYEADALTGVSKEYYKSGAIKETEQYTNGNADGDYKSYYEDGAISVAGQNMKGKAYGEWKFYYNSGKIKEKRNYVNDLEEGPHEEYFENGQVSASFQSKKGKISGEATYFYKDGKVLSKFTYDNGAVRSVKFFDKAGTQVSASEMKNNLIDIVSYGTDGFKRARYSANQKGDLTGEDTLFYPSGKVNQVLQYDKGELNGPVISYYLNGNKKSEVNYSAGKQNGYFTEYYPNGKIQIEGWIIDDKDQGEWDYHDEKGRLVSKSYYLDNDLSGYKEEYFTTGQKKSEQKYERGWLEKLTQFDKDGKVFAVDSFPKGTGKYVLYYPNGKVMEQGNYVNGDFDGPYKSYFFDGSLQSSFFYNKGVRDSTYSSFYYGGRKDNEGIYKNGAKTGSWKIYDENGKLFLDITYRHDQKNGPEVRYLPDGNKSQVSTYKDDELDGTYSKYNTDGSLAYQVEFEEGRASSYSYLGKDGKFVPAIPISPQNGLLKAYFSNGSVARECHYSDGVKNGKDILYYPNGQIRSVDTTAYSISQGTYKEFYPDGKLKAEYPYTVDNVDGVCLEYNANGILKKEEHYDNGSYEGQVKYFDNDGKLLKTMQYLSGTLMEVKNEK